MGYFYAFLSALSFGLMGVLGKFAYDSGINVTAMLMFRFAIAGGVLLLIAYARKSLHDVSGQAIITGILMGAIGYSVPTAFYFAALARADASLVALVFCLYTPTVMVLGVLVRGERISAGRIAALGLALFGIALVLLGGSVAELNLIGAGLAAIGSLIYAGYVMLGQRISVDIDPLGLAALVSIGAFVTFTILTVIGGDFNFTNTSGEWVWVFPLFTLATVSAIIFFFAGIARIGSTDAAMVAVLEPAFTVIGAGLLLGESLTGIQIVGGLFVMGALFIIQAIARSAESKEMDEPTQFSPGISQV